VALGIKVGLRDASVDYPRMLDIEDYLALRGELGGLFT